MAKNKKAKDVRKTTNKTNGRGRASQSSVKVASGPAAERKPMKKVEFEAHLRELQADLVNLQAWVQSSGAKVCVVFEGRDAAGKGGIIKRIAERVSPRVFRTVALPAPTEREKSQMYFQRYMAHFPAAGEIMLFDRSWYNRAGVERVMGFASEEQVDRFLALVPDVEHAMKESGIQLIKYWLEVDREEQSKRFKERMTDGRKLWKLSPMDLESHRRWYDFSRARDSMLLATDTNESPWHIIDMNDQRRGRLNCISHMLNTIPYEAVAWPEFKLPDRKPRAGYVDPDYPYRWVPERY